MLTHLTIKNFAVVKHIELSLETGLTAITGETGAGKSIGIDALMLCSGGRADASMVRSGASKAEIIAHFDISSLAQTATWLTEHELENDGDCFIRRVISAEGRSKAFINGSPVSLQQLKELGAQLISIHGQNAHQQLLKEANQRQLLDSFATHQQLLDEVKYASTDLQTTQRRYEQLQAESQTLQDRKHLLKYQVAELDEFGLQENEFTELETEHKRLSNSQTLLEQAQRSFHRLYEDEQFNALSAIRQSADNLADLCESDASLTPIVTMLNEASIQIDEAAHELRDYCDGLDIDPMRMQQVEQRYNTVNDLARKHQVMPEHLYSHHMALVDELKSIESATDELSQMASTLDEKERQYKNHALALSSSRLHSAQALSKKIEQSIQRMNMPYATFEIVVEQMEQVSPNGIDKITFKIATNPGQNADSLDKVVSGGELARVGLATHVIAAKNDLPPTLIFDEVDTGISGPTASIVGQLLREMGKSYQVLCVTHLPQVAAQAHQQNFVTKKISAESTETHIVRLDAKARVTELARLLAGDTITDSALSNAKSLLQAVA